MDFFKSASPPKPAAKKKNESEVIVPASKEVRAAIDNLVEASIKVKEAQKDIDAAKETVLPYARLEFIDVAVNANKSTSSMKFNGDKHQVSLIVQDRTGNYDLSAAQIEQLKAAFPDSKDMIEEVDDFSFNTDVLRLPKVKKRISDLLTQLITDGVLSEEQAASLIQIKKRTIVKPKSLDSIIKQCDGDDDKLQRVLIILDSNVPMYIKA